MSFNAYFRQRFNVVEAKKDNFEEGWGQCLVELITAQKLNHDSQVEIFGVVSNGKVWEFGRLFNTYFQKNIQFYTLSDLARLFSALNFIFRKSQSYVEGYCLPASAEDWS